MPASYDCWYRVKGSPRVRGGLPEPPAMIDKKKVAPRTRGFTQYISIAAEPRKEALRFSNPECHKSFDDYVSRIKEICEEVTNQVSDNQPVIAQALLDNDLHAYRQAIRNAVASNRKVTAVITNPTETIEQLERTRPEL